MVPVLWDLPTNYTPDGTDYTGFIFLSHDDGTGWCTIQDDYWTFTMLYGDAPCSSYDNPISCEGGGCYWYNGSCHDSPPACTILNNETDCIGYGCHWCMGVCQSQPCETVCSDYTTQTTCENAGCYWWSNNTCQYTQEDGGGCEDYTSQSACETAGCYWYAYPNPIGEPSCHDKQIWEAYLPFIIAGVGGLIILVALFSRSTQPQPQYYPPPQYYPQYYPPPPQYINPKR